MKREQSYICSLFYGLFLFSMENKNIEDFAIAKSINLPPHPSRSARHLPRHGKATVIPASINGREESDNFQQGSIFSRLTSLVS